ncbi:DNA polymerase III subunit epsilon [Rufibacter radiotolerans]|uniref:DNA polymerase III subunit epsilon n=1 Tax=Rufibacter radiotolerans TaxID=1379910 RepID=A0A0H4VJA0_9BACT|nr:exonuclease domain-containing protein [Rufibacter radiotolerans]AKQ45453.1 DNA polymerase III subunit epsilon [Rufibacter radiotolerans]
MYAIVDIETTGGQPSEDRITEIAIFIHDGNQVVDQFHSLVNPGRPIPFFISQLTGITDEMVRDAPKFHEVAKQIVQITEGNVFVAHNVRFDYSFIKKEFADLGFTFQRKTLCTVRLSRKLIPGLPSYSLGKLCKSIDIPLQMRHRAIGDAEATAVLFDRLLKIDQNKVDADQDDKLLEKPSFTKDIKTSLLPPNISREMVDELPLEAGVYYFHDEHGEIIYVGKSKSIRKRIIQHFSIDFKSRKSIEFKNRIASITYVRTGSELVALLFESDEIKKRKPFYNRAQRRSVYHSGIFSYYDQDGYLRLTFQKAKTEVPPLLTMSNQFQAKNFLFNRVAKYNLCQKLCDLYKSPGACFDYQVHQCKGACIGKESPEEYNKRVIESIDAFKYDYDSFVIVGKGRSADEKSVVCVENGHYLGFGYIDETFSASSLEDFKEVIKHYNDNKDTQQIIRGYMRTKHGDKIIDFSQA